jgi:hypothetical protein
MGYMQEERSQFGRTNYWINLAAKILVIFSDISLYYYVSTG